MMTITFSNEKHIDKEQLEKLYNDAEWYAYTNDLELLQQAINESVFVLTACDDNKLVGLISVVGDSITIIYIQDILVLKEYQYQGIATEILQHVLNKYEDVRQKLLLTDEAPNVRHFYEKNGFEP